MQNDNSVFYKSVIKSGAILGLVFIIVSFIIYFFELITINLWTQLLILGVIDPPILGIGISLGILNYKNKMLDGIINYKKALLSGIMISISMAAIYTCFYLIFNVFIAPDYQLELIDAKIGQMYEMMDKIGDDAATASFEKQIYALEDSKNQIDIIKQSLTTLGLIAVIGSVFSLLIAAFVRTKNKNGKDAFEQAMEEIKTEDTRNREVDIK